MSAEVIHEVTDEGPQEEPRLRADARENRDRILEAARALFAERGLEASMRDVARYAEVGPATLYRRFPTKQALIDDVFADELRACRQIVLDGCADPDPWHGFASVIERLTVLNVQNQGFVDAFMSANPHSPTFAHHRVALLRRLRTLVTRAKRDGRLRPDFVLDDLTLVLLACRGLSAAAPANRTPAARRFAALALDGFKASETNSVLPRKPALVKEVIRVPGA